MATEDTVFQYIERAISEHRLPPGTRLREIQLAEIFGVTRSLIRKVLTRLVNAKLVEHKPHIGAQVACPSLKDGQDLFATRVLLETEVIKILCETITEQQLQHLRDYLDKEHQAYQQEDTQLGVRLSSGFHKELANLASNQVIAEFLNEIINRTPLVILSQLGQQPVNSCINHEHLAIVDALEQRDVSTACRLTAEHLSHLEKMFVMNNEQQATDLAEIFQS